MKGSAPPSDAPCPTEPHRSEAGPRPPAAAHAEGTAPGRAADLARSLRVLTSLPELSLRVHWVADHVDHAPPANSAELLDGICEEAGRADAAASEALLAVAVYFAALPQGAHRDELLAVAEQRRLLGLARLLRTGTEVLERDVSARDLPVPDYGTGRELTVGERRSLARRPSRMQLEKLLGDPHPLVLEQLFACPKLTEADVVRIATRRPARLEAITVLTQSTRWMSRRRVRLSLLLNPGCPLHVSVPLVHVCVRGELRLVVQNTTLSGTLRTVAHELLEKRPPLGEPYSTLQ